ncbi:hypothetical protein [Agrobacterium sp. CG674]
MSYNQYLQGKAIQTGCEWRLKIKITSSALAVFPTTAKFSASIRKDDADGELLITLSSDASSITRVDGNTIELILKGTDTAEWTAGTVILDVIRTDLTQKIHLGFDLEIPVKRSITRI